ncbi:heterokaryon incompatibility protein-domain-containing protein, partial [Hyaloscypha sp. PMI_1271]
YSYKPLQRSDSIRLLTLHPGHFGSPIKISLAEVRSQKEGHDYEALSYTWATEDGDCERSSQIRCGGTRIRVTKNCELALRYLRKENSNRVLWVDAICINQKDNKERGHQVGVMWNVYSEATEVLVWLGESSTSVNGWPSLNRGSISVSDLSLDYLHQMVIDMRRIQSSGQDPKSSLLYQELQSQIYESVISGLFTDLCRGFDDIIQRRWWSRVWVVQEVALAKSATLICSNRAVKYGDFFGWHDILSHDYSSKGLLAWNFISAALPHLHAVASARVEQPKSLEVLGVARRLIASDPRDIIFGLLGLSDNFKSLLPLPDYNKSTAQVFTDVAKRHLNLTKSLDILQHATSTTPNFGRPSWVPYWSDAPAVVYLGHKLMKASRNSQAIFSISADDQNLRVRGQKFDRVKVLPLADPKAYTEPVLSEQVMEGWRMSCNVGFSLAKYPTGEPVGEVVMRTLCWELKNVTTHGQSSLFSKEMENFREWHSVLTTTSTLEEYEEQLQFIRAENQMPTPLCITARGYLAAIPFVTKVGDCIAILAGGRLPFVLRPTGNHYRLVGPCYVHGIMYGEAFPENLDELIWFSIH